ncbi:MAG: DUF3786 domain-containing protein [Deltaproteobacteria bacterium]|nr:DUF3786 domain-containing protein [Deltaproteobacteria bacterium]
MIQVSFLESFHRGLMVSVPQTHWQELKEKDLTVVCKNAGATLKNHQRLLLPFLNETLCVDVQKQLLYRLSGKPKPVGASPLLELIALIYLLSVKEALPEDKMIGVRELKDAHFFQGPHSLDFSTLLDRYGRDPEAFALAAQRLGGVGVQLADVAYRLQVFPKIPIYYLLWVGDEEFQSDITVLFDQTIERHLPADAIWGLVQVVNEWLSAQCLLEQSRSFSFKTRKIVE